jgi:16S rRNA G1207 methylase RsmC
MLRHKRTKIRLLPPTSNGPPTPTAADTEISCNDESSVAIKETKDKLQISKEMPTPNFQQMHERATREKGQLTLELRRLRQKYRGSMYVVAEARLVIESLQQVLNNCQKLQKEIEDEIV